MDEILRASVKQLAYKIKGFGKHPRMSFFLGAGASRQSGVITASEMIQVFKERIFIECCPDGTRSDEERESVGYKTSNGSVIEATTTANFLNNLNLRKSVGNVILKA